MAGRGAGASQADGDLSQKTSSHRGCLTRSEPTAEFQQAGLFVTKQIATNLRDKHGIAHPPCFNPLIFPSFVSIIEINK